MAKTPSTKIETTRETTREITRGSSKEDPKEDQEELFKGSSRDFPKEAPVKLSKIEEEAKTGTPSPQAPPVVMNARPQNTVSLVANQVCNVDSPAHEGQARCIWRLKNLGPADVWARWDGGDAAVDSNESIVFDAGEAISGCVGRRLSIVCDSKPAGGARVSFTMAIDP